MNLGASDKHYVSLSTAAHRPRDDANDNVGGRYSAAAAAGGDRRRGRNEAVISTAHRRTTGGFLRGDNSDVQYRGSVNTSLYPMIGSCNTTSCYVHDWASAPRSPCSTCVYEYELDTELDCSGGSLHFHFTFNL